MTTTTAAIDRERAIRADVQGELRRAIDLDELLTPGQHEVDTARRVIADRIAAADRQAQTLGHPPLDDPHGLARRLLDDLLGLGPLQPLLDDPAVEEIIINGPRRVFAISDGRKRLTDVVLDDDDALLRLVRRAIGPLGRRLDEASPMVDARLPDGSRLNAVIAPLTSGSPHVTIRKFLLRARTLDDLVGLGTLSREAADFLSAAVRAGLNILISGGTGSGKTTCLNALGAAVSGLDERVITIEETAELQLESVLPDCVALEARAPNVEGAGGVPIRQLVKNALRMRPTRIIVGEVRGDEALDMLTAMNSGHEGSMCTAHANGPREALSKLRTYALMAGEALPAQAVTEMIAEAIQLVVHLRLDAETHRRVVSSIYEVTGLEGDAVAGSEIFRLEGGRLERTGIRPRRESRLVAAGFAGLERRPS
ncbi:MAG: type II secretion system protein E [Chloroflexi bacterium HGW-Chloroflexi-9]|nr:MAG: type II secretion system protein E [Chloroflexi bacterium HGW-Chloroflexi-9]